MHTRFRPRYHGHVLALVYKSTDANYCNVRNYVKLTSLLLFCVVNREYAVVLWDMSESVVRIGNMQF